MRVGVQGERDLRVAQHPHHDASRNLVGEQHRRTRVPQVMESTLPDAEVSQDPLEGSWWAMGRKKAASIRIGPIGPIPIVNDDDPCREAAEVASRIAQAAVSCDDLLTLIAGHQDPLVRAEAVPRLKARFPEEGKVQEVLLRAVSDVDEGVRCAAISAVADLRLARARDLLATALHDPCPDVRFFAAIGLQHLGDRSAPADPEGFAYKNP